MAPFIQVSLLLQLIDFLTTAARFEYLPQGWKPFCPNSWRESRAQSAQFNRGMQRTRERLTSPQSIDPDLPRSLHSLFLFGLIILRVGLTVLTRRRSSGRESLPYFRVWLLVDIPALPCLFTGFNPPNLLLKFNMSIAERYIRTVRVPVTWKTNRRIVCISNYWSDHLPERSRISQRNRVRR